MKAFLIFVFLLLLIAAGYVGYQMQQGKSLEQVAQETTDGVKKELSQKPVEQKTVKPEPEKVEVEASEPEVTVEKQAEKTTPAPEKKVEEPALDEKTSQWVNHLVENIEEKLMEKKLAAAKVAIHELEKINDLPKKYSSLIPSYYAAAELIDRTMDEYSNDQIGLQDYCEVYLKNGVKFEGVLIEETPVRLKLKVGRMPWTFNKSKIQNVIKIKPEERLSTLKVKFSEDLDAVKDDSALRAYLVAKEYFQYSYDPGMTKGIMVAAKKEPDIVRVVYENEAENRYLREAVRYRVIGSRAALAKARIACKRGKKHLKKFPDSKLIDEFNKLLGELEKTAKIEEKIEKEIKKHKIKVKTKSRKLAKVEGAQPAAETSKAGKTEVEEPEMTGNSERDAYALVKTATEFMRRSDRSQYSNDEANKNAGKAVELFEKARSLFQKLARKSNTDKYNDVIVNINTKIAFINKVLRGWND